MRKNAKKIDNKLQTELLLDLCNAVSLSRNITEASCLLSDLLTPYELNIIAKRLRIAALLLENKTYTAIKKELRVGGSTIARIQIWLENAGKGFKKAYKENKQFDKSKVHPQQYHLLSDYEKMKKKYGMHHLAENLLDDLEGILKGQHKAALKKAIKTIKSAKNSKIDIEHIKAVIEE